LHFWSETDAWITRTGFCSLPRGGRPVQQRFVNERARSRGLWPLLWLCALCWQSCIFRLIPWPRAGGIMPFVIGHRGLPARYPENTLPSFLAAMAAGADGLESDLRLSADGVIMLMHDATLDRTTNCTCVWVGGGEDVCQPQQASPVMCPRVARSGPISSYTVAQLASCNANYAAVFGDKFGCVQRGRRMGKVRASTPPHACAGSCPSLRLSPS